MRRHHKEIMPTPELYGKYLTAEVLLPNGGKLVRATKVKAVREMPMGTQQERAQKRCRREYSRKEPFKSNSLLQTLLSRVPG
jgi:hypothetical protein